MTYQQAPLDDAPRRLPTLPTWFASAPAKTPETMSFQAGAALTVLDQLLQDPTYDVPLKLLAKRLALTAATSTSRLEGRLARDTDMRDAFYLTPPTDPRGPDGDLLAFWRRAAALPPNGRGWHKSLQGLIGPGCAEDALAWIETGGTLAQTHGPLVGCVSAIRATLQADDRAERIACLLSDIVLARAANWPIVLPITAQGLTKALLRDVTTKTPDAALAVQLKILPALEETVRRATEVSRRARRLQAIAPKLRAKGSQAALALFLSEDAILPSTMLSPVIQGSSQRMTARAARRFCDRLVALGVARELTGRQTFRLYGL